MFNTRRPRRRIVEQDSTLHYAVRQQLSCTCHHTSHHSSQTTAIMGSELTLAQRVGLIPKPEQLLTQQQWNEVHGLARQRKDSSHACAICLENFKDEQQVLLSCSHVFHLQCLAAFEQHVQVQACPLCRKQWYQKRIITDAADAYRHLCATRIQAAVRGWLCRKHVMVELLFIPQTRELRRHWAAARLRHAAHALEGLVQQSADDLDSLEAELEATLAASRQQAIPCRINNLTEHAIASPSDEQLLETALQMQCQSSEGRQQLRASDAEALTGAGRHPLSCRAASKRHRNIKRSGSSSSGALVPGSVQRRGPLGTAQVARQADESSPAVRPFADTFLSDHQPTQQPQLQLRSHNRRLQQQQQQQLQQLPPPPLGGADRAPAAVVAPATAAVSWEAVVGQACERGETECAICLGPLAAPRETKGLALLSCSHTFHMQCVLSFEEFEAARSGQPSCPICRAAYTRRCFAVPEAC